MSAPLAKPVMSYLGSVCGVVSVSSLHEENAMNAKAAKRNVFRIFIFSEPYWAFLGLFKLLVIKFCWGLLLILSFC